MNSNLIHLLLDKAEKIRKNRKWVVSFLYLSISFLIVLPEVIAWHNIHQYFNFFSSSAVLIYLLAVLTILGLWYAIFNNYGLAWLLTFAPISLLAQINYIKYTNNAKPLFPWDILIVWEGLKAANSMSDPRIVVAITLGISLITLLASAMIIFVLPKVPLKTSKRLMLFIISLLVIICVEQKKSDGITQAPDLASEYHHKGFFVAFLNNVTAIPKIYVKNYNQETADKIVFSLPPTELGQNDPNFRPNIIIFVSESCFDVTKLPDIEYSAPINPYFQELKKQHYVKWFSPTFGGETANAEFEINTGYPLALFSQQVVPYRLYCRRKIPALASILKSESYYKTIMIHPYYRNFWSRNTVIPNFGFDEFISLEKMKHTDKKGGFVSDDSLISETLDVLAREKGPVFLYLMTIQNHYPFKADRYDCYDDKIKVSSQKLTKEENGILESYANGVHDSDRALKRLIENIKQNSSTPTLVLFLGDHLPSLNGNKIYDKLGYDLSDNMSRYAVDGVVWSNYPIDVKNNANYQMCYIPMKVLEWAKQPMPTYYRFLKELSKKYSVLHADGVYDVNFNKMPSLDFYSSESASTLRYLVYDLLFGKAYSMKEIQSQGKTN